MRSPYVFVGGRFEAEGTEAKFSVSTDGKTWQRAGTSLDKFFPTVGPARYEYQLKCELSGAARLRAETGARLMAGSPDELTYLVANERAVPVEGLAGVNPADFIDNSTKATFIGTARGRVGAAFAYGSAFLEVGKGAVGAHLICGVYDRVRGSRVFNDG